MNDPSQLSFDEGLWLGLLLIEMLVIFGWCWTRARSRLAWFQPPVVLTVVFFYYVVFGPLLALQLGLWVDRGVDLRYAFGVSWQGGAVAYASFLVGYSLVRQRLPNPKSATSFDVRQALHLGRSLNVIGLSLFTLISGPKLLVLLNPLTARQAEVVESGLDLGPFSNYAGLAINLLIPGILLMMVVWVKNRSNTIELVLWFFVATSIFTSLGFRYRLALLFSGVLMLWYLARGRQPNVWIIIPSIIGLISLGGLIGLTRAYGQGLDLTGLAGLGFLDILMAGFSESSIFLTSGGVMTLVPGLTPYAGVTPLINTLLFPLPSALFPGKNSADYISTATSILYGNDVFNAGSAFLNYAEYFIMGGWPALVAGYFLLGWLCRRLWLWFYLRRKEPIAQVTYVCAVVYLYVVISRGYLPQMVMLFCFTVLPLFIYYYRIAKPFVMPEPSFDAAPVVMDR